jgi:hypothetical protein
MPLLNAEEMLVLRRHSFVIIAEAVQIGHASALRINERLTLNQDLVGALRCLDRITLMIVARGYSFNNFRFILAQQQ